MDGTVGEIRLFAAGFAPKNWSYCNGSLIAIRSNTALFSILGTVYGGDGKTTFGLPNLAGRVALGVGQGPGLSTYTAGDIAGVNSVTLTIAEIPPHTHASSGTVIVPAYSDEGDTNVPTGNVLAAKATMYSTVGGDAFLKPAPFNVTTGVFGNGQPLSLNQPSLGMNYIICMFGTFPQRQ
jgi:microcystin-dependent protein